MKVELDLSNYATKTDLKNATGIDTSKFSKKDDLANLKSNVDKLDINAKIKNIEDKIPDITNLTTNTALNAKINEVKNKISNITNLATTTTALTAVENKVRNVSNVVKKTEYNTKVSEIENKIATDHDHDKYITTQEFNKLTLKNFTARLKQANLAIKSDIANLVKNTDFDNKLKYVTSHKNELNELSKKVKSISTEGLTKDLINKLYS